MAASNQRRPKSAALPQGPKYDGSENITAIGSQTYTYDELDRVKTSMTNGHAESYDYDEFGNLTSRTLDNITTSTPVNPATSQRC